MGTTLFHLPKIQLLLHTRDSLQLRTQKQKVESEGMGKSVHKKGSGREWGGHTVLNCLKCHIPTTSESKIYQNPMATPPTEIGKNKIKTKNSFIAH